MKVPTPLNPQTRASNQQVGYGRAASYQVGGFEQIGQALKRYAEIQDQREKNRQMFDVNKALLDEASNLPEDFNQRMEDADLGAPGFVERTMQDYSERHNAILQDFKDRGYSEDARNELQLRLGEMRKTYLGEAIKFKEHAEVVRAAHDAGDISDSASRYAYNNPTGYKSALDEGNQGIDAQPVDAESKTKFKDQLKDNVLTSASQGYALQHPEEVVRAYAPWELKPEQPKAPAPTSGFQGVATAIANEFGLKPEEVAGVFSYETSGTFDPNIMGGKGGNYMGLIQFGEEERKKYGIAKDATPEQWTKAVSSYLKDRGFKPGMSLLDFYSTINAGRPGKYNASDGRGTVRTHVEEILARHVPIGKTWLAEVPEPAPAPEVVTGDTVMPETKTDNPLFNELNGQQIANMLATARTELSRRKVDNKGAMSVALENATSAWLATGTGPEIKKDEVIATFGDVEGIQRYAEYENAKDVGRAVQQFKTSSPETMQQSLETLRPKDINSPTFAKDQEAYQKAAEAAARVMKMREDDPNGYVMSAFPDIAKEFNSAGTSEQRTAAYHKLDQAYKTLGIPPDQRFPYTKDQLVKVAQDYANMNAPSKLAQLRTWEHELDTTGLLGPLIQQMDKHGYNVTSDIVMWNNFVRNPARESLMMDYLNGKDRIKEDAALRPSADVINKSFAGDRSGLGTAIRDISPKYSQILNDAASAIYVSLGGKTTNGLLSDPDLYKEAIRRALGGMKDNPNTGYYTTGGIATILPPTVTKQQFENWKERLTLGDITNRSVEHTFPRDRFGNVVNIQDIIDEGVFKMVAPGQYSIVMSDGKPLGTASGSVFVTKIDPSIVR